MTMEITTNDRVDFCIWIKGLRGADDRPLYFIIWKWPEKHNIRRELWNKISVQRVWGDVFNNNEISLSAIPQEYHHGIIFAMFEFMSSGRTEYMDIKNHSIMRDIKKK